MPASVPSTPASSPHAQSQAGTGLQTERDDFIAYFEEKVMFLGRSNDIVPGGRARGPCNHLDSTGTPYEWLEARQAKYEITNRDSMNSVTTTTTTNTSATAGIFTKTKNRVGRKDNDKDKDNDNDNDNGDSDDGEDNFDGTLPIEMDVAVVLTSSFLYFIKIPTSTSTSASVGIKSNTKFIDAPLLELLSVHPLQSLSTCVVYFGLQRCMLEFSMCCFPLSEVMNSNTNTNTNTNESVSNASAGAVYQYQYMFITRNKGRTQPLVTKIPKAANLKKGITITGSGSGVFGTPPATPSPGAGTRDSASSRVSGSSGNTNTNTSVVPKVRIVNKDSQLVDAVSVIINDKYGKSINLNKGNWTSIGRGTGKGGGLSINGSGSGAVSSDLTDVSLCQMCYQIWRTGHDGIEIARTIIITSKILLLCDEDSSKTDVLLNVLDTSKTKDIKNIIQEDDPLLVTVVFKPSSIVGITHRKWRLKACDTFAAGRLFDELTRAKREG